MALFEHVLSQKFIEEKMGQCVELLREGRKGQIVQTGTGAQRSAEGDQLEKLLECTEVKIDDGESTEKVVREGGQENGQERTML